MWKIGYKLQDGNDNNHRLFVSLNNVIIIVYQMKNTVSVEKENANSNELFILVYSEENYHKAIIISVYTNLFSNEISIPL